MGKISVLVFPCGSENALEIHTALKDCVNIRLFGASSKSDHGQYVFKNYFGDIPFISQPDFIDSLNRIIELNQIDVIIPTHDTVSLFLAENILRVHAKIAVPGLFQAQVCRFKDQTYRLFSDCDFNPKVFSSLPEIVEYPVFMKPIVGEGAKNTRVINNSDDIDLNRKWDDQFLIVEYLPGEELSVDCFSDRNSKLRFVGPRARNRVFSGISVNSFTVPLTEEIGEIAQKINERLKLKGMWFFQLKKDKAGKFKLLEISVRAAGTMCLYRNLGVNFPLLTVYDLMGYDVEINPNENYIEVDRALFNRYRNKLEYTGVYIDFDDTITKNGMVNPIMMFFIYYLKNNLKRITLLTRHEKDIYRTLQELNITSEIFDEIIHLRVEQNKADFIKEKKDVIFIDNSYKDRMDVKKQIKIPVFDVDAVLSLIDWRE